MSRLRRLLEADGRQCRSRRCSSQVLARLTDFGEMRLSVMDKAGIARAVLSVAGPGVQAERDAATAVRNARAANDFLAKEIAKRPDRYSGFAHLAMQDARAAADELERCMRELKLCGAMIDGHTNGQYLDHPSLYPFWERAAGTGRADLHPSRRPGDTLARARRLRGVAARDLGMGLRDRLARAASSVRRPLRPLSARASIILGHLGETLPYLLWRFDSRAKLYGVKLAKPPSQYIKENIVVTSSGMCSAEPLDLRDLRARPRPRDVRRRLSVRAGRGGGAFHRHRGARRARAQRHLLRQRRRGC